jgi:hypothetical protein
MILHCIKRMSLLLLLAAAAAAVAAAAAAWGSLLFTLTQEN